MSNYNDIPISQLSQLNSIVTKNKYEELPQQNMNILNDCDIFDNSKLSNVVSYDLPSMETSLCENSKKYFRRLTTLNIPNIVKEKVISFILSINERFHTISDEELCAHVISAYNELGIEFDFFYIYSLFNINPYRNNVSSYLSNTSTLKKAIVEVNNSINIVILPPDIYIDSIFRKYISYYMIPMAEESLKKHVTRSINLSKYLCKCNRSLIENEPHTVAATIIYFYLKNFTSINLGIKIFSQKVFSELENVDKQKFGNILQFVKNIYNSVKPKNETELRLLYAILNAGVN